MRRKAMVALVIGLVFVGCSSPSSQQRADNLCAQVLHHRAANTTPTTVHEVRSATIGIGGPNNPELSHFAGADASNFAAWCWDGTDGSYTSLAAGPNGAAMLIGTVDGTVATPTGSPSGYFPKAELPAS